MTDIPYQERQLTEYSLESLENLKADIQIKWDSKILYGIYYLKKIKQIGRVSNTGSKL